MDTDKLEKTNIEILETYGDIKFKTIRGGAIVHCQWAGGAWYREGCGYTRDEAAGRVVSSLYCILKYDMMVV